MKVFLRTLAHRWPILVIVLVLTGVSTYAMLGRVGPTYESVGSTLIFPPADVDGPGPELSGGNPYLELSGLTQARDIVIRTLTSKAVRTDVEEAFPGMSFEATPDFTNSAPIILFTVEAETPEVATQALINLMGRVPDTLANLQENQALTDRARITSLALTEDIEPTVVRKDQVRAGILVGAGTLGIGLLFIALLDGMLAVRRRRREASAATVETPDLVDEIGPDVAVPVTPRVGGLRTLVLLVARVPRFRRSRVADPGPAESEAVQVVAPEVVAVPVVEDALVAPEEEPEVEVGTEAADQAETLDEPEAEVDVEADDADAEEGRDEQQESSGTGAGDGFPLTTAYLAALHEADEDETDERDDDPTAGHDDIDSADTGGSDADAATVAVPAPRTGATRFDNRLVSVVEIRRVRDKSIAEAAIRSSTRQREARQREARGVR